MKTAEIDNTIIDGYLHLLESLSAESKLDLISRLALSVNADIIDKKISFFEAFGAWDKNDLAETLITEIRNSRSLNRQIEEL